MLSVTTVAMRTCRCCDWSILFHNILTSYDDSEVWPSQASIKFLRTALAVLSLDFVVGLVVALWKQSQTQYLTLALGTERTATNLEMLPGSRARILAVLYDAFQLMVHKEAPLKSIVDLR